MLVGTSKRPRRGRLLVCYTMLAAVPLVIAGCGNGSAKQAAATAVVASPTHTTQAPTPKVVPTATLVPTYAVPTGTPVPPNKLAMRVNGRPVLLSDYFGLRDDYMRQLYQTKHIDPLSAQGKKMVTAQLKLIQAYLVYREIMLTYAGAHHTEVTDAQLKQAEAVAGGAQGFKQQLSASQQTLAEYKQQITIQNASIYLIDHHTFVSDEVHVRQIQVATLQKAQDLYHQLQGGADFAKLAQQNSTDQVSKASGGDVGFIARGSYDPAYEAAAFALSVNGYSKPFQIKSNYYILHVIGKLKNSKLQGDALKRAQLAYFNSWYAAQRKAAKVEYFVPQA